MHPQPFIEYLAHFHGDRDYFECHEILEEYWKSVDKNNKSSVWVGLIQIAVSNYHHRRGNFKGAERTMQKAIRILDKRRNELIQLGLDEKELFKLMEHLSHSIASQLPYKSYFLPIADLKLTEAAKQACLKREFNWGAHSDMLNEDLIHRHSRRDRTDVIMERKKALEMGKD